MVSGDLIREARLRAGLTQSGLGSKIGKPQSVIARWERGDVAPSFETLRQVIRGCELELHFHLSLIDDSNTTIIDDHLKMTPAQRFSDPMTRVRFHDQVPKGDGLRYSHGMRATIDKAGRLVIPKQLRDRLGLVPGEVEVVADGNALRVESPSREDLQEQNGRLVIASGGPPIDDDFVRSLRDVDQQ